MNSEITLKTIFDKFFSLNGILHQSTFYLSEQQYHYLSNQLKKLERYRESLLTEPVTIVLAGNFSSGKSSFLNALLGDEIVPFGEEPMTMIPNRFRFSDRSYIELEFLNGDKRTIDFETYNQLKHTTKGERHIENIDSIKMIDFYHSSPLLADLTIIDTPGFSTAVEKGDDLITESIIIEHADVLLWVTDINSGELSRSELATIEKVRKQKKPLLVVCLLNKCDLMGKPNSRKAQNVVEKVKSQLLIDSVYPLSSDKILEFEKHSKKGLDQDIIYYTHWLEVFERMVKELQEFANRVRKEKELSLFHDTTEWEEYLLHCLNNEMIHYQYRIKSTYQFFNTFSREIDFLEQSLAKIFDNSTLAFSKTIRNEMADIIGSHFFVKRSGLFDDSKKIVSNKPLDKNNIEIFLTGIISKHLFPAENEVQLLRDLVRNHLHLTVEASMVPIELFLNQSSNERQLRVNLVNESISLLLTQSLLRTVEEASTKNFTSTFADNRILAILAEDTLKGADVKKIMDLGKKMSIQHLKQFLILLEEYYSIRRDLLETEINKIEELIKLSKNGGEQN